jgi:hypothetical protein
VVLPTSACSILSSQLNHCGVPTFNLFALLVSCSSVLSFFFVGVLCAIVVSCRLRFICSSCSCCSSSCDVFFGVLVVAAAATATAPHSASNQISCVFSRVVSPSVLVPIDISCSGYSVRQSLRHPPTSTTALLSTRVFLCFLLRGCLFCVLLLRGCAVRRRGLALLAVLLCSSCSCSSSRGVFFGLLLVVVVVVATTARPCSASSIHPDQLSAFESSCSYQHQRVRLFQFNHCGVQRAPTVTIHQPAPPRCYRCILFCVVSSSSWVCCSSSWSRAACACSARLFLLVLLHRVVSSVECTSSSSQPFPPSQVASPTRSFFSFWRLFVCAFRDIRVDV